MSDWVRSRRLIAFGAAFVDSRVDVNLATGVATGDGNDTIARIEDIVGSPGADVLIGNSALNLIEGRAGPDTIRGGTNSDFLFGMEGNDSIFGESGDDSNGRKSRRPPNRCVGEVDLARRASSYASNSAGSIVISAGPTSSRASVPGRCRAVST